MVPCSVAILAFSSYLNIWRQYNPKILAFIGYCFSINFKAVKNSKEFIKKCIILKIKLGSLINFNTNLTNVSHRQA